MENLRAAVALEPKLLAAVGSRAQHTPGSGQAEPVLRRWGLSELAEPLLAAWAARQVERGTAWIERSCTAEDWTPVSHPAGCSKSVLLP